MSKLTIKGWATYVEKLGPRAAAAVQRGILSGAQRCVQLLQRRTENAAPASDGGARGAVNTGGYRRRWRVRAVLHGWQVLNDSTYADIIEKGRRAGRMPPLKAIEKWAQRRLGLTPKEAKRAAYPIAKAIKQRGLRPRKVLSGAQAKMRRLVNEEVRRELRAELLR